MFSGGGGGGAGADFHMFTHDLGPLLLAMLLVLAGASPEHAVAEAAMGCGSRWPSRCGIRTPPLCFALLAWHVVFVVPVLVLFIVGTYRLSEASPCP